MRKLLLAAAFITLNLSLVAQRYDAVLNELDTKYPQEKLYLQFDKSVYSPGETIWFKAYIFSGVSPSLISKTIYAELVNDEGKVLQRKSAPIIMAGAAAAFDIPANLTSQHIYVRAYTRWMLNFDSSLLYVKAIPIANSKGKAVAQTPAAFLQFFPEGGNLVAGLDCKVAFKATNNKGVPVPVKGLIISNSGKRVTTFSSLHDGMGYFFMVPGQGEQYTAKWTDQFGAEHETALPVPKQKGAILSVENEGNKLEYLILRSRGFEPGKLQLVAQVQQQLLYRADIYDTAVTGSIPLKNVPAGIITLTLFNEKGIPLAERICFVNQNDYSFIAKINVAEKGLAKRAKNVIEIEVPDTLASNLSIAITDAGLNPQQENDDDIFSGILLTSDIKGYVHHPSYYFSGADSAAAFLDLVMMTNGWRRFRWEDALAGKFPEIKYQPENYLTLEGKVSGLTNKQLAKRQISLIVETKTSGRNFLTLPVQPDGTFRAEELTLYDSIHVHYKLSNDKDRFLTSRGTFAFRNTLLRDTLHAKPNVFIPFSPDPIVTTNDADVSQALKEDSNHKVQILATVKVAGKQKTVAEKMNEEYASGIFAAQGIVFPVADDPVGQQALDVFHYLLGRVAGLKVTFRGKSPVLTWGRDQDASPPVYFLNEMVMEEGAGDLIGIPMAEVAMIKVFNPPFLGAPGGSGAGGAIAVYTKKGNLNMQDIKGFDATSVMGYSPLREFYSPDYSKPDPTTTDHRTTLYWEPFVFTDKQNKRVVITFYNNDITSKMRVVLEGINTNGKLTHIEKIIE